ncbi:DUF2206 domain-containing protein [Frankia sp. Ag45/Mut15]|uniref:DUF2206 domain-containing protein n=1 Tax=Frankia umida TaxID=573489 RepID=A0ABT0JVX0_9ACTN|nr:DUF2206 domain-containing protein [Frankia umida]
MAGLAGTAGRWTRPAGGWLRTETVIVALVAVLAAVIAFSGTTPWPVALVGLAAILLIPGDLLLRGLGLAVFDGWLRLYLATCAGLLLATLLGLLLNTVLPVVGVAHPLAPSRVLPALVLLTVGMYCLVVRRTGWRLPELSELWALPAVQRLRRVRPGGVRGGAGRRGANASTVFRFAVPTALPVVAALGAISLDNGGPNGPTVLMLLATVLLFVFLAVRANGLSSSYCLYAVFCVGLAFELMTSLRGWYATGHDIQREYYVFQVTLGNWRWNIADFRDPYNACLSITVLPTMLKGLLDVPAASIFKIYYQFLFALMPVAACLLGRRLADNRVGVLAAAYFVAFPTFFSDMSMLNRQEIAFLFQGGMILLLVHRPGAARHRRALFLALGLGTVLSHYSTTFLMLGQFLLAWVFLVLWRRLGRRFGERACLDAGSGWRSTLAWARGRLAGPRGRPVAGTGGPASAAAGGGVEPATVRLSRIDHGAPTAAAVSGRGWRRVFSGWEDSRILTLSAVVLLAVLTVFWTGPATHTANNMTEVVRQAAQSLVHGGDSERSSDTRSSIVSGGAVDPQVQVDQFARYAYDNRLPNVTYFPRDVVDRYPLRYAEDEFTPPTTIGRALSSVGLDPQALNGALRGGSAVVLQLLVLLGVIALVLRWPIWMRVSREYAALCAASLIYLCVLVVVPSLSAEYGLLRAFQQSLIVLALPAVLGPMVATGFLRRGPRLVAAAALPVVFLISSTGLLAATTGSYIPQLHLANDGDYYESFYPHDADVSALKWMARQEALANGTPPPAPGSSAETLAVLGQFQLPAKNRAAPALVPVNGYIYLDYANLAKARAIGMLDSTAVRYRYPIAFLDSNKNLVYDAGEAAVYR